ncbi:MAG: acetyl/propionyl/methylcrotonyl-CoA carboxylase subunit alpha [Actinomycetota bacterium]
MFERILVANRGEIAVRIARTCRELGVEAVAVYSDVDARARHVAVAHDAVHLPGVAPQDTYLKMDALIRAAIERGAQAIHPGYGFLAESAIFAEEVVGAGLTWIGPPPDAMRKVGDKISARRVAESAGVPVLPGVTEAIEDPAVIKDFGSQHGYPLAVKAAGGGGGRGLKVVRAPEEVEAGFEAARRESIAYFGSEAVFVERYLDAPKHLEVQILSPSENEALWLGVRDCSLQRRHQKLIEETPPPRWSEVVAPMGESAVALAKACGYVNAGTAEFLLDTGAHSFGGPAEAAHSFGGPAEAAPRAGEFYFLEVNARLQVEHTVTEEVLGLDLVACQLRIAAGDAIGFGQADLQARGSAMECRINAEDPALNFIPTPGVLERYVEPAGPGVRVDSGYVEGDEVPGAYDSLIAKLITSGSDRKQARARMLRALDEMMVEGVATTIPAHRLLLEEASFVDGTHTTRTVEAGGALDSLTDTERTADEGVLLVAGRAVRLWSPAMAASATAAVGGHTSGELVAPMQGTILKVLVSPGDVVAPGDPVVVLEAMKMETTIAAPAAGTVAQVLVQPGETAGAGQVVAVME